MRLGITAKAEQLRAVLNEFMDSHVYPAEAVYAAQREAAGPGNHDLPPIVEELKRTAQGLSLWNLFLPDISGLSNVEYAHLAEVTGRSPYLAPEALNCSAPDTGNMELLHLFGTPEQKARWLDPLLAGRIRSGFSMTEPAVASSDATNIATTITRDGDEYVVNGRKWWTTGAADPRCELLIVMGKTDPGADAYRQQSMLLVPMDTPGVEIVRSLSVFGYNDQHGHCEIAYTDARVPVDHLLGEEGAGFAIAQARLGPGRIHHAMRAIGMAERAIDLMCQRALSRHAFGGALADQGTVRAEIAESRIEVEQARLLVLKTAWLLDTVGAKAARTEIAAIKVVTARLAQSVIDRAIQVHGGAGVSADFLLARMWSTARILRIVDGPDEVHIRTVASRELSRFRSRT
ncbi:MAG: acyl-CoA dehydrogenase [Micromonosporaceae bacterium]|jgi:acyl-CoA dehydrogenase|nr:acyl-CoA dehydrogenase [Micromonosporaceae bacterium]